MVMVLKSLGSLRWLHRQILIHLYLNDQVPTGNIYSLRNVERRPVLCFFERIEGGSAY